MGGGGGEADLGEEGVELAEAFADFWARGGGEGVEGEGEEGFHFFFRSLFFFFCVCWGVFCFFFRTEGWIQWEGWDGVLEGLVLVVIGFLWGFSFWGILDGVKGFGGLVMGHGECGWVVGGATM